MSLLFRDQSKLVRFPALGVLTICLILLARTGGNTTFGETASTPIQDPTITVEVQPDVPLKIATVSSAGRMAPDSQLIEFGYYVINASSKPIRAYAIRQEISIGGETSGAGVSLYNPQLSNSLLSPNQSIFIGGTSNIEGRNTVINLSVDFVEFFDGTKWGADLARSSERAAGQRFAAHTVSQKLLQILSVGKPEDVLTAMESGHANVVPPEDRSPEWKEGFRSGRIAVLNRLKRAKEKNNLRELERELRRLGETFKDKE